MNPKSILEEITKLGEIAKYSQQEIRNNTARLKNLRDYKNTIDYAFEKGKEQGIEKGKAEGKAEVKAEGGVDGKAEGRAEGKAEGLVVGMLKTAKLMKEAGEQIEKIIIYTGLSREEIDKL